MAPETARASAVLLTAATPWEASPLARGLELSAAGEDRWEGALGARQLVLLKTGIGERRTQLSLESSAKPAEFGLAVSAGLCGALQEGIEAGDIVADAQGIELDYVLPLRQTATALGLAFHYGKILHTNIVLQPEAKRRLGSAHRALACDMETAAVRRWGFEHLPVLGVRTVLDELDEAPPADSPDGEGTYAMARYALARPTLLPRLLKTGWRCAAAMKTLSRFLKAYLEALPA